MSADVLEVANPEKLLRYAVYTARGRLENGMNYSRSFIVLKNRYGMIARFTRLHEYAGIYSGRTSKPLTTDPEVKLYSICGMLNYILVDNGARFGVRHVFQITKPMLKEYFDYYAMEEKTGGGYHSRDTVERCIATVTTFMANLLVKFAGYTSLTREELYTEKVSYGRSCRERSSKKIMPAFQVFGIFEGKSIFRELPAKAMEILLPMAFQHAREIAFGIALQAFAGLRAGEVCNVRQESSPLGPGLRFVEIGGSIKKIEIDLRREVTLRSDGTEIGRIKKERIQCVYPPFIGIFLKAYEMHKEFLRDISFEVRYAPMFVNADGMAMSYETYRRKFKSLINNHFRSYLVQCGDPELRIYGQLLYENSLGTHALRHWFTVQLVLRGEDIANIQFWRGDSSPESAFTYLQNKGDLVRELEESSDRLLNTLMEVGGDLYGQGD